MLFSAEIRAGRGSILGCAQNQPEHVCPQFLSGYYPPPPWTVLESSSAVDQSDSIAARRRGGPLLAGSEPRKLRRLRGWGQGNWPGSRARYEQRGCLLSL